MKLDIGNRVAIGSAIAIVSTILIFLVPYGLHLRTISKTVEKTRNHGESLTPSEWERVFKDCEKLHNKYQGNAKSFHNLPGNEFPESIKSFNFSSKLGGYSGLLFQRGGSIISNSAELQFKREKGHDWFLGFDHKQVYPPITP